MTTYNANNYRAQGGDSLVMGGTLEITGELKINGGIISNNGTQASAIADLTDNSGGTANNTITAVTDPTDSPVTADGLRDDLVANMIPSIESNFADLAAKVNAILAALRGAGIIA